MSASATGLEHARLGRMLLRRELALVPVGPDDGDFRYTAFFH